MSSQSVAAHDAPLASPANAQGGLTRSGAASGLVTGPVAAGMAADPCTAAVPGALDAVAALAAVDSFQAVAFRVVGTKDTGKVTFLNSHQPYQGHFYVAIFPTLYPEFPAPPAQYFNGRCVVEVFVHVVVFVVLHLAVSSFLPRLLRPFVREELLRLAEKKIGPDPQPEPDGSSGPNEPRSFNAPG